VQALAAPGGVPLWVSGVLPGSTHDLTAARELVLPQARPYLKNLPFLADSDYEGAGAGVHVQVKSLHAVPRRTRHPHENPERPAALAALPGRTRLRADVPAVAHPAARHDQPDRYRRHRKIRPRLGAIRAQDEQPKVAEKTSLLSAGPRNPVRPPPTRLNRTTSVEIVGFSKMSRTVCRTPSVLAIRLAALIASRE